MPAQAYKQTLILMKGHPGTGKSTLAMALALVVAWPLIDKDDIKDHVHHLPNSGALSYEIMWHIVHHQLEIGLSVIVDSTLSYQRSFDNGQKLAIKYGTKLLVVETTVDDEAWRERLDHRLVEQQSHRTSGWDAMQQLLVEYDSSWRYTIAPQIHLVLNTNSPTDQLVQTIIARLQAPS